jgi:hypothetical protein
MKQSLVFQCASNMCGRSHATAHLGREAGIEAEHLHPKPEWSALVHD